MSRGNTWGEIYRGAVARAGFDAGQVRGAAEFEALVLGIAEALEYGWSLTDWPELMEVVQVEPRLATDAAVGPLLAGATAEELASGRGWYLDGADFEMGDVEGVSVKHPWSGGYLQELQLRDVGGRLLLLDPRRRGPAGVAGVPVWVTQRRRCPQWRAVAWAAASEYVAGAVVAYPAPVENASGVWRCVANTTLGQSPVSHAAKWVAEVVPVVLGRFAIEYVGALWLQGDGQLDKQALLEAKAEKYLLPEIDRVRGRPGRVSRRVSVG